MVDAPLLASETTPDDDAKRFDSQVGPNYILADQPPKPLQNELRSEPPAEAELTVSDQLLAPAEIEAPEAIPVEIVAPQIVDLQPRELAPTDLHHVPVELSETVTSAVPPTFTSHVELKPPPQNEIEESPEPTVQGSEAESSLLPIRDDIPSNSLETPRAGAPRRMTWNGSEPVEQPERRYHGRTELRVSDAVVDAPSTRLLAGVVHEFATDESTQAEVIQPSPDHQMRLKLRARTSHSLRTEGRIRQVSVSNRLVCDAMQFAPFEVAFIAKNAGETNVTLWMDGRRQPQVYRIAVEDSAVEKPKVGAEYAKLKKLLDEMFPASRVTLTPGRNQLVVAGRAKDQQEAIQIMSVIRSVRLIPVIDRLQVRR